ncbi:hypothetical protein BATDEDRAFT_25508 [Batrachochytrium dendrobatidis JAM81]|uniref:Uncharacterized protein n=1 Tax=Batrachochytrium dendrobatidis (strain JAM81 / FGSC 10211) TaxID=684364 RepID=F4P496_BATDJ|nr:uncharacterized protein BATDEDRAFT_25508 [Batrachochytrium dendrobatidis JAM81]EGF79748.1 hypothetical protein BATDEDRAFT_25508 [Batrachochytrium dendrobatidis JAM81]|eukprot:XP_006679470.1 hypothetical protein BATDEDRAFT_25508 [Batrachochytrium dendrobatidis JAM81]
MQRKPPQRNTAHSGSMGLKAERFKVLPSVTGKIGPGSYEINQTTCMKSKVMSKPTSVLGVCLNQAVRFPTLNQNTPGVGKYEPKTFIDLLNARCTRSYDKNYAIGRNVANDSRFAMSKSGLLKKRQSNNSGQVKNLQELIGKDDIFTDKRACRRMAYLSLYYD